MEQWHTCCLLTRRVRCSATEEQGRCVTMSAAEGSPAQASHGAVILLVEDDASIRQIFTYGLTQEGFTVLPAKHSHEALKYGKEYPSMIHLVITDLGLPDELRLASNTA